jgi:hypothetical protein
MNLRMLKYYFGRAVMLLSLVEGPWIYGFSPNENSLVMWLAKNVIDHTFCRKLMFTVHNALHYNTRFVRLCL